MNKDRRTTVATTAALLIATAWSAVGLASPARAQVIDQHLAVDCPQPFSQNCPGNAGPRVMTQGPLYMKFTADPNPPACAPGEATFVLNDWHAKSQVVQPGESFDFYDMRDRPEEVYVEVQMKGVLGGCNTGAMSGWSGTLHVETDADALKHAPAGG